MTEKYCNCKSFDCPQPTENSVCCCQKNNENFFGIWVENGTCNNMTGFPIKPENLEFFCENSMNIPEESLINYGYVDRATNPNTEKDETSHQASKKWIFIGLGVLGFVVLLILFYVFVMSDKRYRSRSEPRLYRRPSFRY